MITVFRIENFKGDAAMVAEALLLSAWDKMDAREDLAQVFDRASKGYGQLWGAYDGQVMLGCILTELQQRPKGRKICLVYLGAGGRMVEWWGPMSKMIGQWAASQEADTIELIGRNGWQKWCRKLVPSARTVKVHMAAPVEAFL